MNILTVTKWCYTLFCCKLTSSNREPKIIPQTSPVKGLYSVGKMVVGEETLYQGPALYLVLTGRLKSVELCQFTSAEDQDPDCTKFPPSSPP